MLTVNKSDNGFGQHKVEVVAWAEVKLKQLDRNVETFLLQNQDGQPESHWSLGQIWRLRCVLSGVLTHFSPLLPTRGQANSCCNSKPIAFLMKFITFKEKQKAQADGSNSGSEKGGESKLSIQIVSCSLYGISSVITFVVIHHGLCLRINYHTDLAAAQSLFEELSRCREL